MVSFHSTFYVHRPCYFDFHALWFQLVPQFCKTFSALKQLHHLLFPLFYLLIYLIYFSKITTLLNPCSKVCTLFFCRCKYSWFINCSRKLFASLAALPMRGGLLVSLSMLLPFPFARFALSLMLPLPFWLHAATEFTSTVVDLRRRGAYSWHKHGQNLHDAICVNFVSSALSWFYEFSILWIFDFMNFQFCEFSILWN